MVNSWFSCLAALLLCIEAPSADASIVWNEQGDAGALPATSQQITGSGPLIQIDGTLAFGGPGPDVDMYCLTIEDVAAFTATVILGSGSPLGAPVLQLWLFDVNGNGVTSQEGFYLGTPTRITGTFVPNPGKYYLAISAHDVIPFDASANNIWSGAPRSIETPPNGASMGPVAFWSAFGNQAGRGPYSVELTGAGVCCLAVPAPGTLSLALFALLLARGTRAGSSRQRSLVARTMHGQGSARGVDRTAYGT